MPPVSRLRLAAAILAGALVRPAHAVLPSAVNAGCYLAAAGDCRVHIDPITINMSPGRHLVAVQVRADDTPVYDFRADAASPPSGSYSPSTPALDVGVQCNQTVVVTLLAQDSGDPVFAKVGETTTITCPSGTLP